jgi:biopolymer transport protein ExbD
MTEEIDEINVVPLVDVMLVLLTIVLTTATFVVNGRIPVNLAASKSAQAAQVAPLVLTLTHERVLLLNDAPIALGQGPGSLSMALEHHPRSTPVVVRADGRLALTAFVELVDQVKAMGFTQVSLEVKRA